MLTNKKVFYQMAAVLFMFFIFGMLVADYRMAQKKKQFLAQIATYEKKIEALKNSNESLEKEITNADSQNYLQKIAYEQGLAKTGEREIIFTKSTAKTLPAQNIPENNPFAAWLSGLWSWLKSKF